MKRSLSIQFKAVFLLVVFSFNTVIGFACSVGLDMGFNSSNGHEKKHEVAADHHGHTGDHNGKSHHQLVEANHHSRGAEKDNCCKDEVIKFEKVDKQGARSVSVPASQLYFHTICTPYFYFNALASDVHTPENKYFVRCHHPPIPDIRIAIQSFLL